MGNWQHLWDCTIQRGKIHSPVWYIFPKTKFAITHVHSECQVAHAELTIIGTVIPDDNYINYLGLILDKQLNFHPHIEITMNRCYGKM